MHSTAEYESPQSMERSYHYIHLKAEDLKALPVEGLLQACLEFRNLLLTIMSLCYTPSTGLIVSVTAIDLTDLLNNCWSTRLIGVKHE